MRHIDELFEGLGQSRFRSRFELRAADLDVLKQHGLAKIMDHTRKFVDQRLRPAAPSNDGRQTPMRGHPVFVAQHATATCCRRCLRRWHHITEGYELIEPEISHILAVIQRWLIEQAKNITTPVEPSTSNLFTQLTAGKSSPPVGPN